jgi:sugar lactone lactonase YvrE
MSNSAEKVSILFQRKHVNWVIQIIFLITAVSFFYSYTANKDVLKKIQAATVPGDEPSFVKVIYGKFGTEFDKPMALTVANNRIYVSDTNNRRVQILDYEGNLVKTFGASGTKPEQFQFPYGLAGDSKGVIYVADLYNSTVAKFDKDGKYIGLFAPKSFKAPAGMAIKNDLVYVTDVRKNNVQVFDLSGKLVREVGKPGGGNGELLAPNAIAVDNEGAIYVSDTGNQRVQVFDKNGKFVRIINGAAGKQTGPVFVNPRGIAVDDRDRVYVLSNLTHRLYGFTKAGAQLFNVGGQGEGENQFTLPNGMFIDDLGRVYVTDTANQRIEVFQSR